MSNNQIAELLSPNLAQRYGLLEKGDIALGYDADLVLFDPNETFVVRGSESESQQDYTPKVNKDKTLPCCYLNFRQPESFILYLFKIPPTRNMSQGTILFPCPTMKGAF